MNEDLEFKDIDEDDEEKVKIPEIHGTKNYMTRACYNRLLDERKNLVFSRAPERRECRCLGGFQRRPQRKRRLPVRQTASARNRPPHPPPE